jgi:hypothetical protein
VTDDLGRTTPADENNRNGSFVGIMPTQSVDRDVDLKTVCLRSVATRQSYEIRRNPDKGI